MRKFRSFVEELGTHTVSLTVSSIVLDMESSYWRMKSEINTEPFCWEEPDILLHALHEFVLTRECWHYEDNHEPALEVTFGASGGRRYRRDQQIPEEVTMHFHYSWNPPVIDFVDLQNVVVESTIFTLKPTVSTSRPFSEMPQLDIEYYLGPATHKTSQEWLQWDNNSACFRGMMPYALAPALGAQRLDSYTLPLELTTKITKQFPSDIRYETIIRCALPLTVKRQADGCKSRFRASDWLPSPLKSMLPSMIPHPDALDVHVRMVRDITLDSETRPGISDLKGSPHHSLSIKSGPSTPNRGKCTSFNVLKVNRRGDLSSDSEGGSPYKTPQAVSIQLSPEKLSPNKWSPQRCGLVKSTDLSTQTCPEHNWRLPDSSKEYGGKDDAKSSSFTASNRFLGDDPTESSWDEKPTAGNSTEWPAQIRSTYRAGDDGGSPWRDSARMSLTGSPAKGAEISDADVALWQQEIQRNYQESLAQKQDVTIREAEAWSDEE